MNWQGEDCSKRTCPFDQAWADTPLGDLDGSANALWGPMEYVSTSNLAGFPTVENWPIIGGSTTFPFGTYELYPNSNPQEGHFYAECSSKGTCNRDDGVCACFAGFEGTACQRMVCPNKCSGHGICANVKTLAQSKKVGDGYSVSDWSGIGGLYYQLWDRVQVMGCSCDSLYTGPDCSLKKCPLGVDPLYRGSPLYEEAYVDIYGTYTELGLPTGTGLTYAVLGKAMKGTFDLVIYDNLGTEYVLDGLTYCDYTADASRTTKWCTQPAAIMAYFANKRLQSTQVGVTNYAFVSIQPLPTAAATIPDFGVRYWFNYKKGNPGYHKDLFVKSFTPVIQEDVKIASQPVHSVYHYVVQQGMDCDYLDMWNEGVHLTNNPYAGWDDVTLYNFVLPGYISAYTYATPTTTSVLTASTDWSFWLGNPSFTGTAPNRVYTVPSDKFKTNAIMINGLRFEVQQVTGFGGNNWLTGNGLTPLTSTATSSATAMSMSPYSATTAIMSLTQSSAYSFTTIGVKTFSFASSTAQLTLTGGLNGPQSGFSVTPYSAPNLIRLNLINIIAFPANWAGGIYSFYSTVTVIGNVEPAIVDQSRLSANTGHAITTGGAFITDGKDIFGYDRRFPVYARLTPAYQYVTHCAGRGTCNHDTGLCECFSGYKTAVCDTQAPQC